MGPASGSSTSTEHRGEPCIAPAWAANPWGLSLTNPSTSFPFLIVKIQAHPSCVVFSLISGQNGFIARVPGVGLYLYHWATICIAVQIMADFLAGHSSFEESLLLRLLQVWVWCKYLLKSIALQRAMTMNSNTEIVWEVSTSSYSHEERFLKLSHSKNQILWKKKNTIVHLLFWRHE